MATFPRTLLCRWCGHRHLTYNQDLPTVCPNTDCQRMANWQVTIPREPRVASTVTDQVFLRSLRISAEADE